MKENLKHAPSTITGLILAIAAIIIIVRDPAQASRPEVLGLLMLAAYAVLGVGPTPPQAHA